MSKYWGPPCWIFMHSLATRIKPEEFEGMKENLWQLINEICNNLPCPDCRQHATTAMKNTNKKLILSSRVNFETFLFDFHNAVNRRNGSRLFARAEYDAIYKTLDFKKTVINFINAFNRSTRNSNLMIETFHRQRFIQQFITWINMYKDKFA